ncbi:MAG: carboxypeptidase regulatory-like domain-containing protein [Terriglobia bacterium]
MIHRNKIKNELSSGQLLSSCILLLAFLICAAAGSAQSVSSLVQGVVQDPSGAIVPGAHVTLINVDTGVERTTETDAAGRYVFPSVLPGTYSLEVSKAGFQNFALSHFRVVVAQRATEDAVLKVGATSQTVTVSAQGLAALLQPGSNDLGNLVEPSSVEQLPLNGRNFLQLGLLSGATQSSGPAKGNADFVGGQGGHPGLAINIGGNAQDFSMYLINGIATSGSRIGQAALNLSIGDIDQFEVHYGFFMPDLGPDPGIVNVITKSGTNHFHGEAFEFLRNNALEARDFFSPAPPGPFHQNQFGGDIGGPIRKDRLFFFASYEGLRQDQSAFAGGFTPTAAMFNGDFSALPNPIYNPSSFDPATGKRQAFAGNIIPSSMINPVAKKMLQFYLPGSSYSEQPNNLFENPRSTYDYDQFSGRIDASLTPRNMLYGQFSNENSPVINAGLFPLSGSSFPLNTQLAMVQWTATTSPTVVNDLRAGWTRDSIFDTGETQNGVQGQVGITGTADPNGLPGITLTGFSGFGHSGGLLGNVDNIYQAQDSLSWLRGNHQMEFGAIVNYARSIQQSADANARGTIKFTGQYTAQLTTNAQRALVPAAGTGSSFADFLLGMPTNGQVVSMPRTHYRWTTFEPYAQDSWKIRPGLTANLGIAWYVATPPDPVGPDTKYPHALDFSTGHVLYAALGQISPEVYSTTYSNLAPRVGLAWQPGFSKNTVIRAGWGVYYASQRFLDQQFEIVAPGVSISQSIANPEPTAAYLLGQNVFPPISLTPITQQFAQSVTGTLFDLSTKNRTPYIEQWNLDAGHTFAGRYLVDVSYFGNEGHFINMRWNADDCSVPGSLVCNPAVIPFKQYPYVLYSADAANSNYQALVAKFQRQFSGGLSFLANYTWSKALTNSMEGGSASTLSQIAACRKCDKGLAAYDVPQALVLSTVWELPVGRGRTFLSKTNPVVNAAIEGWGLDFITTFQKGFPFEVTATNFSGAVFTDFRANRLCNGRAELQNQNLRTNGLRWIDASCFSQPTPGLFGTSGFDILTGPGLNNWDVAIHREIPIHESARLQFRAEFFNAWNHAQFSNPNNNVADVNFGRISGTQEAAREIQFALKLLW